MAQKNARRLFQPNAACKNVLFFISPSVSSTYFPQNYDDQSNPFYDYFATNVMTDDDGELLLTVISSLNGIFLYDINYNPVYDPSSTYVDMLTPNREGKEIVIVPINKGVKYWAV
jgi:hypothetical protein